MLVESYDYVHLLPNSGGTPSAFNSAASSSYIPHISYDDFTRPQDFSPQQSSGTSARQHRRMRTAPYPLSISTNVLYQQNQHLSDSFSFQQNTSHQHIPLHSPRPQPYFNPAEAFDNHSHSFDANVNANANPPSQYVHSPLGFTPGAHGTILGPFASESDPTTYPTADGGELTATQMAYMHPSTRAPSPPTTPSASSYSQANQARNPGSSSFPQIQMPQVPCVPQVPAMPPPPMRSLPTNDHHVQSLPNNEFVRDAVPPEPSESFVSHTGPLVPPAKTFQTPSELLIDLSLRDADEQKNLRRREERRITQRVLSTPNLGFTATDPETIPIHSKKRYYLDCLEQYVVYLHNQLRLIGVEPVPVERVSTGRGPTSRSIRTMIVYLKSETAKLHVQKNAAEIKYKELRAQLGADADPAAPFGLESGPSLTRTRTRNRNQTVSDSDSTNVHSGTGNIDRRRHSIAIGEPYPSPALKAAYGDSAHQPGYSFPADD